MNDGMSEAATQPVKPRRPKRRHRWLLWIGGSALASLLAAGAAIGILLHRAAPLLRASLIDTLEKRFHAKVELDDLHASILDGFQVEGSGLRIWLPTSAQSALLDRENSAQANAAQTDAPLAALATRPWIVVDKIRFHASWRILPGRPIVVSVIHAQGVRVALPPKADRPHLSLSAGPGAGGASTSPAQTQNQSQNESQSSTSLFHLPPIEVRKIECQDALLEMERTPEPGKPPRPPLDFEFHQVTVVPDGRGGPMAFAVDMVNAKPVGNIHSTGHAGPWVPSDPGSLPVDGDYTFDHADLGTIKGIEGTLSSTGHYSGTLRNIVADGQTQTPDFRLERVSRSAGEMLTTRFHAIIDGTNGNTRLDPVDATLGHTHIVARGQVLRAEDSAPDGAKATHGHDIQLNVLIDRGRIEDILAISADKEFLTGNLTLQTSFHLPPGAQSVVDKLQLDGQFHLNQVRFTNAKMQGRIEELSLRGQGKPQEVRTVNPASVLSAMQGHFKLSGGQLQLPDLDYRVPGADIAVHGAYGLNGGTLNFDGDAKLEASLSKIVGGWKGLLLSPADRFLRKNGAGTDVPIHITGTRKDPKFGVDFGRLGKNSK